MCIYVPYKLIIEKPPCSTLLFTIIMHLGLCTTYIGGVVLNSYFIVLSFTVAIVNLEYICTVQCIGQLRLRTTLCIEYSDVYNTSLLVCTFYFILLLLWT